MSQPSVRLLGPQEIRTLAASVGASPTKKWGQNFLHDPNTIRKILAAADVDDTTHALEVGPGLGSLTLGLIDTCAAVTAVEIDPVLAELLPSTAKQFAPNDFEKLTVVHADALTVTAETLHSAGVTHAPQALIANLPYNVAVPVILTMLERFPTITRVLVMVQKEVADRLAADPGSKIYGVPSVKARFYGDCYRAGIIGRHVFWPEPRVDSALVRIDRTPDAERAWSHDDATRAQVFPLIDAAFAQRRKMLRAALKPLLQPGQDATTLLEQAGIDPLARGEQLDITDFVALAKVMHDSSAEA